MFVSLHYNWNPTEEPGPNPYLKLYNLQLFHCFHFPSIAIIIARIDRHFTNPLSLVPLQERQKS